LVAKLTKILPIIYIFFDVFFRETYYSLIFIKLQNNLFIK